eukprot:scaffold7089_cov328-Pinguiococcus_pyrenoidosus.AAC.1
MQRRRGEVFTLDEDELNCTEVLRAGYRVIYAHWMSRWATRQDGDYCYLTTSKEDRGWHKLDMNLVLRVHGLKLKKKATKNLFKLSVVDRTRLMQALSR